VSNAGTAEKTLCEDCRTIVEGRRMGGHYAQNLEGLARDVAEYHAANHRPKLEKDDAPARKSKRGGSLTDQLLAKTPKGVDPTHGPSMVEELNTRYAFVLVGGKQAILEETGEDFDLLTVDAFKAWLADRPHVRTPGYTDNDGTVKPASKPVPLAHYWLTNKSRRNHRNIIFDPSGAPSTPDAYNIWKGYAVQPSAEGSCDLFLAHLKDNVAQGNDAHYRFIVGQLAQWVQQPSVKLGISLVLRGDNGVGKSIVGKALGLLFGRHLVEVASQDDIVGHFNSHLKHCLVLLAEEAFWAGSKQAQGVLLDLITNNTRLLEFKGKDKITVGNYTRLLVTSNADWVVPTSMGDRRFAIFDVSDARKEDHEYFGKMWRQLTEEGGAAALLHYLLAFDLGSVDLWKIPQTSARLEQKQHSLNAMEGWWLDVLQSGELPGEGPGTRCVPGKVEVSRAALHKAYCEHAKLIGYARRSSQVQLGLFLRKHVPALGSREKRLDEDRYRYALPKLSECREAFWKELGRVDWRDPEGHWNLVGGPEAWDQG
jgi:hypothetical protein